MPNNILLLAGTKKGLFIFSSDNRAKWQLQGPFLPGKEINHAIYHALSSRLFGTSNDSVFGSEIVWSADLGKNWTPAKQGPGFSTESGLKLERVWHIHPGPANAANILYAGTAPAALFRSIDQGETWEEVTGLTQHPSRSQWNPGGGGLCLHSIAVDSRNPNRIFVAISAAGMFRSDDAGKTWRPLNKGVRAEFLPDKYPEFGHCVHKLLPDPNNPSVLFQQNHCGVYRSRDAGESWQEITTGLPSDFGFPLAVHPRQAETIYVIPLKGAELRCPPDARLRVFRSRNGGDSWEALSKGLPQENVFVNVYREGMTADHLDPLGIYFGTNTGKIFASYDEGNSWRLFADNLPPVYSVTTAAL